MEKNTSYAQITSEGYLTVVNDTKNKKVNIIIDENGPFSLSMNQVKFLKNVLNGLPIKEM